MAVLTAAELAELRHSVSTGLSTLAWTKADINAASQAIEDYFETTVRPGVAAAIEVEAPGKFTAGQKKKLVAHYLRQKFIREGV